jgi:serine/threonine protein kinase, bacterial
VQPHPFATGGGLDEPATADLSGRCIGNSYILICPVGHGATGTVWRGIERATGDQVAVKLLHEGLLRQPKVVTRFVQERTILMMVRHENIVGVRDLFSSGDTLGLVMDFVSGGSLRERLRVAGTLAPAEAARLLAQVAAALSEAHGFGVVHRDVKPDNILLHPAGERLDVRLTDFGIARVVDAAGLTTTQAIIGTPYYMAPEVISGGDAGPAADVYAVGVVLYELLTGRTPYTGEAIAVLRRHLDDQPERPAGLSDRMWSVIESCLDKDPSRRPAADDLGMALREVSRSATADPALPPPVDGPGAGPATGVAPSAPPAPARRRPLNRPRSWVWGRPGAVAVLVAGAVVASGFGGYQAWQRRDTSSAHTATGDAPGLGIGAAGASHAPAGASPGPARHSGPEPSTSVPPSAAASGDALGPAGGTPGGAGRVQVSAGPAGGTSSAGAGPAAGDAAYGPWQCGDKLTWDVGHPVLAWPCQSLGDTIRVIGHLSAAPGVRADVSLTVRDTQTKEVVAGPYGCDGLTFTEFLTEHTCGPVDLTAPHGRRYAVVEDWKYSDRNLLPGGSTTGPAFNW